MVLTVYTSLEAIDKNLFTAARSLGAGGWGVFRRVTLPLSLPGVYAGGIIVFIITLGAYVTPALIGGPGDIMIAQLVWINVTEFGAFGTAIVLILPLIVITMVPVRSVQPVRRGRQDAGRRRRPGAEVAAMGQKLVLGILASVILLFIASPIFVVLPLSFSDATGIQFPPEAYSLRRFREFFGAEDWLNALWTSAKVSFFAVLVATPLGTGMALGPGPGQVPRKELPELLRDPPAGVPDADLRASPCSSCTGVSGFTTQNWGWSWPTSWWACRSSS